MKWHKIIEIA